MHRAGAPGVLMAPGDVALEDVVHLRHRRSAPEPGPGTRHPVRKPVAEDRGGDLQGGVQEDGVGIVDLGEAGDW